MAPRLIQISQTIHANPELAFEEYKSMALLADTAEAHGFAVTRGVADLETAFEAVSVGNLPGDGPTVAFLAEYDALPGLGHACGHNIIGTAATGAALAMMAIRDEIRGTVKLIGTPAEEKGGGKAIMVERGVFDGVDAAMMIHPGSKAMVARGSIASNSLSFEFFGKAAHAAAAPDKGINALDACIQTFVNINALRQHLTPDVRIHGIIVHGGDAVNVVPKYARADFSVRRHLRRIAGRGREGDPLRRSGRWAGATLKATHQRHYAHRIPNPTLAQLFAANVTEVGETVVDPDPNERKGSSDMGNVSHLVPAIHPYMPIVDPGIGSHTPEFAEAAASERGDRALIRAAKALAMTAVDLLTQPELIEQAKAEHANMINPNARWRQMRFFGED
ncbi:MAG: M20 family metallopeptidase [Caldilineaceae bacterium]